MKKKNLIKLASVLAVLSIGVLSGCSSASTENTKNSDSSSKTIKVGAAVTPHSDILEFVKPKLAEKGINLEIVNLDSEDQLNPALDEKAIDANYFQPLPYLESVSKEKGYDFQLQVKFILNR